MQKYRVGQHVYYIGNGNFITEAIVKRYGSGFYTLKHVESTGGTRLRESRLFASKDEAEKEMRILSTNKIR